MKTEKGKSIDAVKYVGDKTKIESARIEKMKHGEVVKIVSEEVPFKAEDSLPEDKKLHASAIFGLQRNEAEELIIIQDGKFDKFLKAKQIEITETYEVGDNIKELLGVECVIQKNADGFLELA